MESHCILSKRSLATVGLSSPVSRRVFHRPVLPVARSFFRILAMASSEEYVLQWQPAFRFEQAELMADAPCLLKTCADFDWKAQASKLRELAKLSLRDATSTKKQLPSSNSPPTKGTGEVTREDGADTWFAAGLALATATLLQFGFCVNSFAAEVSTETSEAAEAASRAPAWLTPALLAFPLVSYALFYAYRSQVNPDAKVTDWVFGVAATVIIANLVLISTIGVRLY